mgnify:FL=1
MDLVASLRAVREQQSHMDDDDRSAGASMIGEGGAIGAPAHQPDSFEVLAGSTVMLVDGDAHTLDAIGAFLMECGYRRLVSVSAPAEALERIAREKPDVLLLELMMAPVSGFDILAAMRRDEELRYTPVIVLTAASDGETRLKALELGATEFLSKPVDPSELTLRLRNTLAFKAYRNRLAHYDSLTGLPNRRLFLTRLQSALRRAGQNDRKWALLHVDLDRFKQINESLGYKAGDALLKAVAQRIEDSLRAGDTVARASDGGSRCALSRLGGDEFTVLVPDIRHGDSAGVVARRIIVALSRPFRIAEQDLYLTPSIGIAVFPEDGDDPATLLKHAEVAMYEAKQQGRNTFQFYSSELSARSMERLSLETGLRRAIERGELMLHYQPKVDVATGRVVGVEALLRWMHPTMGMVPPGVFIPVAEEAGLMGSLGNWVLHAACGQAKVWEREGLGWLKIAINVASPQFLQRKLTAAVVDALTRTGIQPGRLILEVTESMIMASAEDSVAMLREMKDIGVELSVDDFGTGYSSLAYLKRFPLDEIKIDRSFIKDTPSDPHTVAIVVAVLTLAAGLGLRVVGEGVETAEQLDFLKTWHCHEYQGFYFSRPVPARDITRMLRKDVLPEGSAAPPAQTVAQEIG